MHSILNQTIIPKQTPNSLWMTCMHKPEHFIMWITCSLANKQAPRHAHNNMHCCTLLHQLINVLNEQYQSVPSCRSGQWLSIVWLSRLRTLFPRQSGRFNPWCDRLKFGVPSKSTISHPDWLVELASACDLADCQEPPAERSGRFKCVHCTRRLANDVCPVACV